MRRIPQVMAAPGKKLVPFFTAGYPQLESTVPLVLAAEKAGAQLVELGMPFSDPLADGPVIQQSSQTALENGVTVPWILKTVARIREQSQIPIILMGYINPIRRMGAARFLEEAAGAGVDGLIIPDLPPEEDPDFFEQAREAGLSTIFLVAPNTGSERMVHLGREAGDLLYAVSIMGVTGTALSARQDLTDYLKRVRLNANVPFVVGFGIATPQDVRRVGSLADGVVVGSALLQRLAQASDPPAEAYTYLHSLAAALP